MTTAHQQTSLGEGDELLALIAAEQAKGRTINLYMVRTQAEQALRSPSSDPMWRCTLRTGNLPDWKFGEGGTPGEAIKSAQKFVRQVWQPTVAKPGEMRTTTNAKDLFG